MHDHVKTYWETELSFLGPACCEQLIVMGVHASIGWDAGAKAAEFRAVGYAIRAIHAARQLYPRLRDDG